MAHWIRFDAAGSEGFGTLDGNTISVHSGEMFGVNAPAGSTLALDKVRVLTPCRPTKMIALWNNFGQLAAKLGTTRPDHPLYLLKAPTSFLAHGEPIRRPAAYAGKIVYEGELAIVIGKRVSNAGATEAAANLIKDLARSPQWQVVGVFDDDRTHHRRQIHGATVYGAIGDLPALQSQLNARHAIIGSSWASGLGTLGGRGGGTDYGTKGSIPGLVN